jgi:hypothetical protein
MIGPHAFTCQFITPNVTTRSRFLNCLYLLIAGLRISFWCLYKFNYEEGQKIKEDSFGGQDLYP